MEENRKLNYVKPTVEEIILSVNERVAGCDYGSVPPEEECGVAAATAANFS
ncbi:MAG: hypothetical protein LBT22_01235 [Peptococcaceae bacterium]|jgi:hypothetical protein|nr:hypothetical protein [Peptococcaceae bacterium]